MVITDSLGMGAVAATTPQDEAAELAITAGADIALVSGADAVPAAHARLVDAITTGRIPSDQVLASVRRVLAMKGVTGQCLDAVARYSSIARQGSSTTTGAAGDSSTLDRGTSDAGINSTGTGTGTGSSTTTTTGSRSTSTTRPTTTVRSSTTVRPTTTAGGG